MNISFTKSLFRKIATSAAIFSAFGFATIAFAGVTGSAVPDYPVLVTAGQTGAAATVTIINGSTGVNDSESISLTSVSHTPSCGSSSNTTCIGADIDTGVFTVHNGTGRAGTACAATVFTAGVPDGSGAVTFTPGSAVTLGPSTGSLASKECIIDFTVDVLKVPTKDANAIAIGVQTDQLASASFTGLTSGLHGSAVGSNETTVNKASPSISTIPSAGGTIGTLLNDTATLSGGSSPTGTVTFTLYAPSDATCDAAAIYTDADSSSPYATLTSGGGFTSTSVGTYHWRAVYGGDANNNATSSPCSAETVTTTKASPSISTTPSAGGLIGTVLNDTATLSGGSTPTGNVTFNLYAPIDATCSAAAVYTQVDPSAAYGTSPGYTSVVAGTYRWTADYAGDANNNATSSPCTAEPVVITAPKGHIIVDKITIPGSDPQSFHFLTSGTGYVAFDLTDQAAPNNQEVDPGTYTVAEQLVTGWDLNGGHPVCIYDEESVGSPVVANGEQVTIAAGQTVTCTFTNTKRGSISGMKFNDLDGNGIKGISEGGLSGWTIGISTSTATATTTTTTDGSGNYSFPNLQPGNYLVCEVQQAGWTQTAPASGCFHVILSAGQSSTGNDFGNHQPAAVQGCSPGYWKQSQHFGSYPTGLGIYPTSLFSTVFGSTAFGSKTLLQVLSTGGGGQIALGRIMVGAYLNSYIAGFPFTPLQVVAAFNGATPSTYGSVKDTFEALQDPCPLGRNPGPASPAL